jgi:hypothetical protein
MSKERELVVQLGWDSLDLGQNLSWEKEMCDPRNIKPLAKLSRKKLIQMLNDKHETIICATRDAYALHNRLGELLDLFPLEGEK